MSIEGGYSIATFCLPFDDDESVNVPELCFVPKVASRQEKEFKGRMGGAYFDPKAYLYTDVTTYCTTTR